MSLPYSKTEIETMSTIRHNCAENLVARQKGNLREYKEVNEAYLADGTQYTSIYKEQDTAFLTCDEYYIFITFCPHCGSRLTPPPG